MKNILFFILFFFFSTSIFSQIMKTNNAYISFYSKAVLENIEAHNYNVECVFDTVNNQIAFLARITDFDFEKKLMKKHFCEKYMEEEDYPFSSFSGNIYFVGKNDLEVKGVLEIHGQKKEITVTANIDKSDKKGIVMKSNFKIELEDFRIKIPKIVKDNISKLIEVNVVVKF